MPGFVDGDRYPIGDLSSDGARSLAARCRAELDESGVSILPGFLTSDAIARAVAESEALGPRGHHSDVEGTPYLELPEAGWTEDHPRVTWAHTRLTATAYDLFPPEAVLRTLYESDALLAFLSCALGFEVFRYDDPLGGLNLASMYDGDTLAWHYDQTDFVVSVAVQESETGGDFECVPNTRTFDDERYDDVAEILAGGADARVATIPMTPGTLMLFEGRHTLHRVSPIGGARPRYVGLFGYDRKPGTCSSELLRLIRYGRAE
ncbi:MAG TPA: hypothetical protein VH914_16115 [Acidimicrobiia bacterium]|nr:hypothetical protein [Acidimicrobiia bacterium]